ncbi:HlyD family secretion protein [Acetitomaculum ruminis DSM 5522]|uniref:HlyD family secretion protein n=1 Tax=Acetitomaculum ruminis DSM 5522 TaxID=1120918 RepID=A0A1I0Y0F0_9FIRM|nr:efflux RND transporter periplasmic adaptor subunit [Acetitomaculum ruminis]SFB06367.1 HlyD family secretion protein [Acetitomaculum ruminis DSM 5522]
MEKKKKSKKKFIVIGIIIVVLLLLFVALPRIMGFGNFSGPMGETTETQTFEKQDLSTSITASGTVESQNTVSVTTELTSKCTQLNVSLGDSVKKGDVLCVFDDTDIKSEISNLESQVSNSEKLAAKQNEIAQRQLNQAKSERETSLANQQNVINDLNAKISTANSTLETLRAQAATVGNDEKVQKELESQISELTKEIATLESSLAEANNQYSSLDSSTQKAIESAQDTVETNQYSNQTDSSITSQLSKLYSQLNSVTVTAEQDGIITSLNISKGGVANGTLMTISDDKNLQISISLSESDVIKVEKGMTASISSDAIHDDSITGTVSRVINFTSKSSSSSSLTGESSDSGYSADISVNGETKLLLGMNAKVEIVVNEVGERCAVAYDAVAEDENGQKYVYKVEQGKDNTFKAKKVEVTTGESNDYYVEISSDSLSEGDLIVSYPEKVQDGQEIFVEDMASVFKAEFKPNGPTFSKEINKL